VHPGALAVAWTLAFPAVSGAIVGARRATQVDDWIAAPTVRLGEEELTRLAELITRTGAGSGPVSPGLPARTGRTA